MRENLNLKLGFGLERMLIYPAARGLGVETGLQVDRTKGG